MFHLQTKIDDLVLMNKSKRRTGHSQIRDFYLELLIYLGSKVINFNLSHLYTYQYKPFNIQKTKVL
jgi:hypothetical protein